MSFEGYYQIICENGHYHTPDCYYYYHDEEGMVACSSTGCKGKIIWSNLVDVTNGSFNEDGTRMDGHVEPGVKYRKLCPCCNSILDIRYEPPKDGGRRHE